MNQAISDEIRGPNMETETRNLILLDNSGARMPFRSSEELEEEGEDGDVAGFSGGKKRKLRVLVADNCRDAADSLSMLVKIWGYKVSIAYDGAAALEIAFAYQPDVLVLDIAMPKMDGYHVARQIRRQARFDDTRLIAVTGWADQPHRLLGDKAGFDYYLIKPVDPSTLEVLLAVEQSRLMRSAFARCSTPRALEVVDAGQSIIVGNGLRPVPLLGIPDPDLGTLGIAVASLQVDLKLDGDSRPTWCGPMFKDS